MSSRILPESIQSCTFVCENCNTEVKLQGHHGRCPKCNQEYWVEVEKFTPMFRESDKGT